MVQDIRLLSREGLPEELLALRRSFPRDSWAEHPEFGALTQFWLDRHGLFRRLLVLMTQDTRGFLEGKMEAQALSSRLARYAPLFAGELHGHHHVEDAHYFPLLLNLERRLERGFTLLDADHHELDERLHAFAENANALLSRRGDKELHDLAGKFHDGLGSLERMLDRHLTDEEDIIVPIILSHGEGRIG